MEWLKRNQFEPELRPTHGLRRQKVEKTKTKSPVVLTQSEPIKAWQIAAEDKVQLSD